MNKTKEQFLSNYKTLSHKVDSNSLETRKVRTKNYAFNSNGGDNSNPAFFELISLTIGVRRINEQHKQENKI